MAPRKDTMRIIRQDAGFSAKLGFGGQLLQAGNVSEDQAPPRTTAVGLDSAKAAPVATSTETSTLSERAENPARPEDAGTTREAKPAMTTSVGTASSTGSVTRGHVVYVAVSLTARQATLAESWADAARCSVQFLIRHVAQGLRDEVFDDWEQNGVPDVEEPRGARGRYPTSVTMTLRPEFAANLAARHDPHGILGLARVMGPAFRARFEAAFDIALANAKHRSGTEGDEK